MRQPLEIVFGAQLKNGILRILSKDISGRLAIVHGQTITGAHVSTDGSTGLAAVRALLTVNRGMFAYYEPDNIQEFNELNEGLEIPVIELLDGEPVQALDTFVSRIGAAYQAAAGDAGPTPESVLDRLVSSARTTLTGVARRTLQGLQKLSSRPPEPTPPTDAAARVFKDLEQSLAKSQAAFSSGEFVVGSPAPSAPPPGPPAQSVAEQQMTYQPNQMFAPAQSYVAPQQFAAPPQQPAPTAAGPGQPPQDRQSQTQGQPEWSAITAPTSFDALPESERLNPAGDGQTLSPIAGQQRSVPPIPGQTDYSLPTQPGQPLPEAKPPVPASQNFVMLSQQSQAISQQMQAVQMGQQQASQQMQAVQPQPPSSQQPRSQQIQALQSQQQMPPQAQQWAPPPPQPMPPQPQQWQQQQFGQAPSAVPGMPPNAVPPRSAQDENIFRRTAQKIVSRLKMAKEEEEQKAKEREKERLAQERAAVSQERLQESQRLRTIELEVVDETEQSAKFDWRSDKATLMGILITVVFVGGFILCKVLGDATGPGQAMHKGEQYMAKHEPELAIKELNVVLNQQASDAKALALRAAAFEQIGDWHSAINDYDKLASVNPSAITPSVAVTRALLLYRIKRYPDALTACDELLSKTPDDKRALTIKGMALARSGKYEDALAYLTKAPSDMAVAAKIDQAYSYFNQKQYEKALDFYTHAVADLPQSLPVRRERAMVELKMDKTRDAINDLKAATDLDPRDAENFAMLADVYEQAGDFDQALKSYKSAVALEYLPGKMYFGIARCQMKLKAYDEAKVNCDRAAALRPEDEDIQKLSEKLASLSKTTTHTYSPITPSAPESSTNPSDLSNMSVQALVKEGTADVRNKPERAAEYLEAAINRGASDTNTRLNLARALMNAGDYKKAYQHFLSIEHNGALPPQDLFNSGRCALSAGMTDDGISILNRCLAQRQSWMEVRLELIKAHVNAGHMDKAQLLANQGCAQAATDYERNLYKSALTKK
ncbi:MAG TPA: tetratricopeptide repeat protein [Candidatus Obscuribacterales bacterium]